MGQSLVEFALVLPLLLVIFSGAADLGRAFYNYVALENSVKEGALYGSRYPLCATPSALCLDPNTVRYHVQNEARIKTGGSSTIPLVTPTTNECRNTTTGIAYADPRDCVEGDTYVVGAQLTFNPVTPIIGNLVGPITLQSESRAIVVNQAFDPTPGLAPTKLVKVTGSGGARNASVITTNCVEPDPVGSPSFYRSPCMNDTTGVMYQAKFRSGDTITYKLFLRNNGGTNVTGVTLTDTYAWPGTCSKPTSMAVGAQWSCTYTRTAPAVSGSGPTSDYMNTFTVDGNEILPTFDAATVTLEQPPADLRVLKFVSPYQEGSDGDGSVLGAPSFGTLQSINVGRLGAVNPTVWFKVIVSNAGGQTATGLSITDTHGSFPTNALCPARPSTLAAGASWSCRYSVTFSSNGTTVNTVTATAAGVTPDGNDSNSATVNVASCTGSNKLVPVLIGLTKAQAQTAWTGAGFTSVMTAWNGQNSALTLTQDRQAYSCLAPATTVTITRTATP